MSGKKGSEVASVLKMGETARKDTDKKYDIKIKDLEKKTQSTYEKAQNLEHTILEKKIQGTKEAQQMFALQLRQEEERLAAIKKQAVVKFKAKDIKGRLAEVKSKLVSADNKAADIRARIAYKHDYCDNEYREATAVKNTYSACRADYENIYNKSLTKEEIDYYRIGMRRIYDIYLEDVESDNKNSLIYKIFLSKQNDRYINNTNNKRKVIDFIAGMTDDLFLHEIEKYCKNK